MSRRTFNTTRPVRQNEGREIDGQKCSLRKIVIFKENFTKEAIFESSLIKNWPNSTERMVPVYDDFVIFLQEFRQKIAKLIIRWIAEGERGGRLAPFG